MLRTALFVLLNTTGADGFSLPTEFRLFRAGVNDTTKGRVTFDAKSAASVMAAYKMHAVQLACDLEHLSLNSESPNYDPNARAWFDLELRNGELWAVNVVWNEDGEKRLRDRTQRFISPAFYVDKTGRVTRVLNVGLVAQPATYGTEALVAASQRIELNSMDPELLKKAIEAIKNGSGDEALTILEGLIVTAAGGEGAPAEPDPAIAEMTALTEAPTPAEALSVIKTWQKSHQDVTKKAADATAAERKTLVGKLVTLGAETPATAFVEKDGVKVLCDRLAGESLDSLKSRVTTLSAGKLSSDLKAGNSGGAQNQVVYSKIVLDGAKKLNISPAEFAERANAAIRTS